MRPSSGRASPSAIMPFSASCLSSSLSGGRSAEAHPPAEPRRSKSRNKREAELPNLWWTADSSVSCRTVDAISARLSMYLPLRGEAIWQRGSLHIVSR
eukprot:scaffold1116_cov103-Isochrysis_galbana.AAC.4